MRNAELNRIGHRALCREPGAGAENKKLGIWDFGFELIWDFGFELIWDLARRFLGGLGSRILPAGFFGRVGIYIRIMS